MRLFILSFLLLLFYGCADKTTHFDGYSQETQAVANEEDEFEQEFASEKDSDPLEGYNRAMTAFNDGAIRYVVSPIATGYKTVVPDGARSSIGNFFSNIAFPIRLINNLLQGEFLGAFEESKRFVINTTVGFLGFFDVADEIYEIEESNEDFGQTLGVWGVPAGTHIVLPFFGPSNLRDIGGRVVDGITNPLSYYEWREINLLQSEKQYLGFNAAEITNSLPETVDNYKMITKDAVDMYPLLKNTYEQRRNALIKE